ncbi:40S ribosomal protein S3 [Datura stramonium]|uniref:40S ribosomal protein S3 n=1 Tax=Datura stramonium TaxID=4076 RepID=A0ABS8V4V4_DATST|nr:40S ribosomal protein S3 [Datura stramonium]
MSADKARRVIDQIRGRSYEETLMDRTHALWSMLSHFGIGLVSAAANASYNMGSSETNLVISKAEVNGALEPAWITSRQIEAGRRAMTRKMHVVVEKDGCTGSRSFSFGPCWYLTKGMRRGTPFAASNRSSKRYPYSSGSSKVTSRSHDKRFPVSEEMQHELFVEGVYY